MSGSGAGIGMQGILMSFELILSGPLADHDVLCVADQVPIWIETCLGLLIVDSERRGTRAAVITALLHPTRETTSVYA